MNLNYEIIDNRVNVIIIGSGPAAFTAAIYTGRAQLAPLLIAGPIDKVGGQLITTTIVENYPGFADGIDGYELVTAMQKQAENSGTKIIKETVVEVLKEQETFIVKTDKTAYLSKSVIVASGAYAKKDTSIPGVNELWNKGISACATCDGPLFRGAKRIVVIGGGDTAMEEALFLSRFAEEVAVVHRREELRASKIMVERARKNPKIKFYLNSRVAKIEGKESVQKVTITATRSDPVRGIHNESFEASAVFFAIGHSPNSEFVKNITFQDEYGYIMAVKVSGLFTAGDVCDKEYRQAITAAGEGCKAALKVVKFLEE